MPAYMATLLSLQPVHTSLPARIATKPWISFVLPLHTLMAENLVPRFDVLQFTAEEEAIVLLSGDNVEIPSADFACSLVGSVRTPDPVDGSRVVRTFRGT